MKRIIVADDIFKTAADRFVDLAIAAIDVRGRFNVALAGGSTPKALYEKLASEPFRSEINWSKVCFFFGDERNVPRTDPQSNFRMADESLFKPLSIGDDQIFRWPTEESEPAQVAEAYSKTLTEYFASGVSELPRFDLILLGLGEDGHTASLFPDIVALTEEKKTAIACFVEKLDAWRFSLTFPVINNASTVMFLVSGEKKAGIVKKVLDGDYTTAQFPARGVDCDDLIYLLDRPAAALIDQVK